MAARSIKPRKYLGLRPGLTFIHQRLPYCISLNEKRALLQRGIN